MLVCSICSLFDPSDGPFFFVLMISFHTFILLTFFNCTVFVCSSFYVYPSSYVKKRFFFARFTVAQLYPDLPAIPKPDQELENLFLKAAGSRQEIGWMELKQILDHSMRGGE